MTSASRVTTSSPASISMSRYFINKVNFAIENVSNSFVYYYLWCERVVDSLGKKNSPMNNVLSDGRENRLSTTKEARITFRGESSEVKPDQQLCLNQRDVNRAIHDPNKFIDDNRDALPENVSAFTSRDMGSVCTDELSSVSPQKSGTTIKK